jgi:type III secretory pathway component EscV
MGAYLALEPETTEQILAATRGMVSALGPRAAGVPILVAEVEVRPYLRRIVMAEFPSLHVLSRQDLARDAQIHTIAQIRLGGASDDAAPTGQGQPA